MTFAFPSIHDLIVCAFSTKEEAVEGVEDGNEADVEESDADSDSSLYVVLLFVVCNLS